MWVCWMVSAWANTWIPIDEGFVSPPRSDAPTNGALVYGSNFLPLATVTDGPDAPFVLEALPLTAHHAAPRTQLRPPPGGWQAGATYTVSVEPYDAYFAPKKQAPRRTLTFTVGQAPAEPPGVPVVGEAQPSAWSEEEEAYPWGCCKRVRNVTLDVEVPDADPWSWVEAVGDYDLGPSQITTDPGADTVDMLMGSTRQQISWVQWVEQGVQPACVDIVPMSAAGIEGEAVRRCASDRPGGVLPSGCDTAPHAPSGWWLGGLLLLTWRRTRPR